MVSFNYLTAKTVAERAKRKKNLLQDKLRDASQGETLRSVQVTSRLWNATDCRQEGLPA